MEFYEEPFEPKTFELGLIDREVHICKKVAKNVEKRKILITMYSH